MAKYQDTVEILIAARDEATREMKKIRSEIAATRDDLSEGRGAAGAALKLHGTLLKVGAATEGVKSAVVLARAAVQGLDGDWQAAHESVKDIGFGIGEVIRETDKLGHSVVHMFTDLDEHMADFQVMMKQREIALARQEQLTARNNRQAEIARETMETTRKTLADQIELMRAGSEIERERLRIGIDYRATMEKAEELRKTALKDTDDLARKEALRQASELTLLAEQLATERERLRVEQMREQAQERLQRMKEERQRKEEAGLQRLIELDRKHNRDAADATSGRIGRLRDELSGLAGRDRTIALGEQSGRFVSGVRDSLARRENPIIESQRQAADRIEQAIKRQEDLLREINQEFKKIGSSGVELVPLKVNAGGNF